MSVQKGISFNSLEEFFDHVKDEEQEIVYALRDLILDECPDIEEKLSYNVPFYYGKRRVFFIWPASVPWGNVTTGVMLGFCQGAVLEDPFHLFVEQELQQVRRIHFNTFEDVKIDRIREYLVAAYELDQSELM